MFQVLPRIEPLLAEDRLTDLGPGTPNLAVRAHLDALGQELDALAKDRRFALACLAGLWLCHGFFDESHAISQDLDTVEGSFWHGILHRREPDFGNAKYWFRRVPGHPVFADLCREALTIDAPADGDGFRGLLENRKQWDPFAFIDLCERALTRQSVALKTYCGAIQRCEWELLFQFCHERAFA